MSQSLYGECIFNCLPHQSAGYNCVRPGMMVRPKSFVKSVSISSVLVPQPASLNMPKSTTQSCSTEDSAQPSEGPNSSIAADGPLTPEDRVLTGVPQAIWMMG